LREMLLNVGEKRQAFKKMILLLRKQLDLSPLAKPLRI